MTTFSSGNPENDTNRQVRRIILTIVGLLLLYLPSFSQHEIVNISSGNLLLRQAMSELELQTAKKFAFSSAFNLEQTITFPKKSMTLNEALEIMTAKEFSFTFNGDHVLIYSCPPKPKAMPALQYVSGLIRDEKNGTPLKNALVEIIIADSNIATHTDALGYFSVNNVPAGHYIARIQPADGRLPQYSELTTTVAQTRAEIIYKAYEQQTITTPESHFITIEAATSITETDPVTTYYYFEKDDNPVVANPRSSLTLIPESALYSKYKPQVTLKTNFLLWATTTPNVSLEVALARKWTIDIAYAYNPWHWNSKKSYRFWGVQPEVRYWFCNRFERHFIGLHGIYGQFNMGKFKRPFPNAFKKYRYEGKGYGVGLAYGYHLPIARRLALEFTIGAGWVHLDYDKYRCGACDEHEGDKKTDYFGPTKAGLNLIFFIK